MILQEKNLHNLFIVHIYTVYKKESRFCKINKWVDVWGKNVTIDIFRENEHRILH